MLRRSTLLRGMLLLLLLSSIVGAGQAAQPSSPGTSDSSTPAAEIHNDVVIKGGTLLTVTHGRIENGSIHIHNGRIAAIGKTVGEPARGAAGDGTGGGGGRGPRGSRAEVAVGRAANAANSPVAPHTR